MPVSVAPSKFASSASPASSGSIAPTSAKRTAPTLGRGDPSNSNYTYTYGYNFGYIANGLSLIEEQQQQQRFSSLTLSTVSSTSSSSSTTSSIATTTTTPLSTNSTGDSPAPSTVASTKVSLTFPPTSGPSPTGTLLQPSSSSNHPFSPHYSAYIDLVTSSGGYSKLDKALEGHRAAAEKKKVGKSKNRKATAVPLDSQNPVQSKQSSSPPQQPVPHIHAVASSPKRKAHFDEREDIMQGIEDGGYRMRTGPEDVVDYFSLPKSKAKKVRMTKDAQMKSDEAVVSPAPAEGPPLSSSSSSSTSALGSDLFSSALGLSTTGTWAATPSLVFTPGSSIGGDTGNAGNVGSQFSSGEGGKGMAVKTFTKRSPSPTDSTRSLGSMAVGMISLDLLDRPRSPGVFTTQAAGNGVRKGKDGVLRVKPRGLWRARGTGPLPPLPSILDMNAGEKNKSTATNALTDIHDRRTTHIRAQSYNTATPTAASTFSVSSSTPTPVGSAFQGAIIGSASRRERRLGETGYESCSSSCSSDSLDDMSEVAKNLKRRRMRRRGGSGSGLDDDESRTTDGSSSSSLDTTSASMPKRVRRRGEENVPGADVDQRRRHRDGEQQQHDQSRKTFFSPSTTLSNMAATSTTTASTSTQVSSDVASQQEEVADATKYFTRSKIMDTTSLARTRFSDNHASAATRGKQPAPPEATYEDWEDLKEVWARCLEVIDSEEPEEVLPLLRGIIHECGRFLEAYEDPSILILDPPAPSGETPSKVDSGVGTDSVPPTEPATLPTQRRHPLALSSTYVHPKDLPTAFHTLLGTALFFFGNLIDESPHLALEGEPTSKVFYHLYALDVFEMGENVPARTGVGEGSQYATQGTQRGSQPFRCQDDCCTPGSKEDWRLATTWGRALVSLAEELLEREQICNEWLARHPQPALTNEGDSEVYFNHGRPTYFGRGPSSSAATIRPNPASFLSEDFISSGGVVQEGYFNGTGGKAMGLRVDGMGGLTVAHSDGAASGYLSPIGGLQLPSSLYPLSSFGFNKMDGDKTPISPRHDSHDTRDPASPRVLAPFGTLAIGEASGSFTSTTRSPTISSGSGSRSSTEPIRTPHLEDPRRHWKKDSPFVVIWNRMPPITRRMILGGTQVSNDNPFPSPALPTPSEPSTFTLSWWHTDDTETAMETTGIYPSDASDDDRDTVAQADTKPKVKKSPGASVDEMMGLAVDHLSRGLFHMPRTGRPRGLGGVGGIAGGPVDLGNGHYSSKKTHLHNHRRHHHHHHRHHHHNSSRPEESEGLMGMGGVQPFSRASHLLTIAMEVLMLAEKLPSAKSRYRWASHADSIFEQMRLEESPGIIKPRRREEEGMDLDIELATGRVNTSDPDGTDHSSSNPRKKKAPYFRTARDHHPLDAPLHLSSQAALQSGAAWLDSNRNEVILKARGRCSLIIGSAIAEDKIESYLDGLDEESMTPTPESARRRREEVVKLLRGEDADEARAKLRESVDFLERARAVWRDGVAGRRKERERTKQRIEHDRKARREAASGAASAGSPKTKPRSGAVSAAPRRRGIGALAAENKKKRKEKEKKAVRDAGMAVEDDAMSADVDVEMGDMTADSAPASPDPTSSQAFGEEDMRLLELFAVEEREEEREEQELARLIAEAIVTLANILLVAEEGDEELGLVTANDCDEIGSEREREELYMKGKEEMRRAGMEEVDAMI